MSAIQLLIVALLLVAAPKAGAYGDCTNSGSGWTRYELNDFSNANQKGGNGKFCNDRFGDDTCTSETTYRSEDNLVLREGEPVSCETIGFASGLPQP